MGSVKKVNIIRHSHGFSIPSNILVFCNFGYKQALNKRISLNPAPVYEIPNKLCATASIYFGDLIRQQGVR